ncbi:MAG: hypothetical protein ABI439_03690 [Rhodospirillales bacterium]
MLASLPASAQQANGIFGPFGQPTVSFSADFTIDSAGFQTVGHMNSIPLRRRVEVNLGPRHVVSILFVDLAVGYALDLDRKTYSEFSLGPTPNFPTGAIYPNWTLTREGEDNADGYVRTRYRAEEMKSNGDGFRGTLWVVDAYNLVVEAHGANMRGGKPIPLTHRIFNIKVGPQDPTLFQPPADFTRFGTGVDPVVPPARVQP